MGISARIIERSPIFGLNKSLKAGGGSAGDPICPLFPKNFARGSGDRIYKILRPFAQGGMSILYEVQDGNGKLHLLKMPCGLDQYDEAVQIDLWKRFRREVRILHGIHHTDILPADFAQHRDKVVRLTDWDPCWDPAKPSEAFPKYYIEEMIVGHDLEKVVESHQVVDSLHATTIIYSVMLGLVVFGEVARRLGEGTFAHRDLKPGNIRLEMIGGHIKRVVLMDFGIAHLAREYNEKLTKTGAFWGTPDYPAPETFPSRSDQADQRSDIFVAGFIWYELLTGMAPFDSKNLEQTRLFYSRPQAFIDRLAVECQQTGRVPVNVRNILFRALSAHPDNRYQSYAETAGVLHDLITKLQRA
ncbi:MAG: protein kinase [Candidatus Margulisiibacteriota bacterium]